MRDKSYSIILKVNIKNVLVNMYKLFETDKKKSFVEKQKSKLRYPV
jgi:hypothetical protein